MGYQLRVERDSPLAYAELAEPAVTEAGFAVRGSQDGVEIVARHADGEHLVASWRQEAGSGSVTGEPVSDWQVAQLVRLSEALGGRLVGEDGEFYRLRDGVVEQVSGSHVYEFGKIEEILAAGPAQWSE
ncbi:hypothetical protein GCM10010106_33390 [Thermopolyspora flexuosa]|jgi:hypothetical protein|uniref:Uncharacterized protein n=1 Tax=Thermopolyspora flexuosa TaxID=103836 RepID=A0A543IT77_9ACTN|nr:hypothetical protein [Thermopolyspora flexuosa]TQM73780.1 hypothetical protein FHX40_0433 [Thermopolyspora flexuosa]GGM84040.1 hypothetical protein GCM10010106_33390 [Thermopolyspora flexuosa]